MKCCLAIVVGAVWLGLGGSDPAGQTAPLAVTRGVETQIADRLGRAVRGNVNRHRVLREMFEQAGCTGDALRDVPVPGAVPPNLVCTLTGAIDRQIIVSAHFDMTGPGLGIGDNWGSTSLLPTLYQALREQRSRRHTFVFIGFSEEEAGLVGARAYVRGLSDADRSRIAAVVNMDGVGMARANVWHTRADARLLQLLDAAARRQGVTVGRLSLDGAGAMDSFVFTAAGIPALSLHGLAPGTFGIPHTTADDVGAVSLPTLMETYGLLLQYVRLLDVELVTVQD